MEVVYQSPAARAGEATFQEIIDAGGIVFTMHVVSAEFSLHPRDASRPVTVRGERGRIGNKMRPPSSSSTHHLYWNVQLPDGRYLLFYVKSGPGIRTDEELIAFAEGLIDIG